jgi:predicted phospho-2-dehydro-3-deoxyheptonate aldolase
MIGKTKRLHRIFHERSEKIFMVPLDHGVTLGPVPGLDKFRTTLGAIVAGGVDAVVLHKGMIVQHYDQLMGESLGLMMHLSASTVLSGDPTWKILTGTVEEALALGCDAVSVHVNLGADHEAEMVRDFAAVATQCSRFGLPLLAMVYTRGKNVQRENLSAQIKHAARVGAELGADLVKVSYTGDPESFQEVVMSCPIPVLAAGGEHKNDVAGLLRMTEDVLAAGVKGISMGRNIFQHERPKLLIDTLSLMIHQGVSWETAYNLYQNVALSESSVASACET